MKFFLLSLLASSFLMGCATAANMRSVYQPSQGDGPWTQELHEFDRENPEYRNDTIFP